MTAPSRVLELVERFERDKHIYKSASYNETQTRQEFIDPLFGELGWDIGNRGGAAAAFRDVVLEYSMKIGDKTKAPDYLFQLGGTPKFFVEAKKPSVNLKDDISPAFQIRRYAWSATLPLSVLTDFEEFAIYDCRVEPNKNDKPATERRDYFSYTEYEEKWDTIANLFSREAVLGGSLERFAQEKKATKGATTVDVAFLREIESWRELLARNIAIWNPELTQRELNYTVQMTLDRIIFLRIAEDRGIEPYEKLRSLVNVGGVYKRLVTQFRDADDRYNSGLFHFKDEKGRDGPDGLTLGLHIDDEPLQKIIRNLYYPDSPYEFSVMPVELLGRVYEQFLGKVIHLTSDRKAVVEEKPEVRKAGGVYYTPAYIVDYIVKNTVGKLLEGKTPREAAKLRILDPACGSGSFLLGAYQHLLDWHLAQYVAAGPTKHKKEVFQGPSGEWRLTSAERKRILLNNIYGVDIDAQAVEVTKLSLSLKVLEGENSATLGVQTQMFQERALPSLENNIKCGNSLIESDFYDQQEMALLDEDEQYRINVFDWEEGFPQIMRAGGFDAVIGNPPYIRVHRLSAEDKKYFWLHYKTFVAKSDIYACFIERGVRLLRSSGMLSFITPNTWSSLESFTNLRKFALDNTSIEQLIRTPTKVFKDATVRTFIFVLCRSPKLDSKQMTLVRDMQEGGKYKDTGSIKRGDMLSAHLYNLLLHSEDTAPALFTKCVKSGVTVGSEVEFFYGFKTGDDDLFLASEQRTDSYEPFVRSADVTRYSALTPSGYVDYRPEAMRQHRSTARPGDRQRFERPKILVARMGRLLLTTLDEGGVFVKDAMLLLDKSDDKQKLKLLAALLNSRLMQYLYQNHFATIDVLKNALLALPLPNKLDHYKDAEFMYIISRVEQILNLQNRLAAAKTSQEKTVLQRQIDATDKQIDKLVYELYGLTDEEIEIVEGATK